MRHLSSITVGQYIIEAHAEHVGGGVTEVTVHSGDLFLTGRTTHQGKHDHTPEQFEKGIMDFATRLAEELAGTIHSEELAANFAKDQE
jgi:hypothetical protein